MDESIDPTPKKLAAVYFTGTGGQLLNYFYICCSATLFSDKKLSAAL